MQPTTGRIVHLTGASVNRYDTDPKHCIAAIVTHMIEDTMYATAFPWHGTDAARKVILNSNETQKWHDPKECPNA